MEEHEKQLRDARTAVMADVGRQKKAAEDAMRTAQAAQERLNKLLKDQEQAELEAAKDNPEKLSALQERQKRRQIESELETARTELNDKNTRLTQYESREAESARETKAREIAARLSVDATELVTLSKYTNGTPEAIEEIAKRLPKGQTRPPLKPDSNTHIGGGATWEEVRAAYIKDPRSPAIRERYLQMRKERGR
jgi:hypothetical protein